MSKNREFFKKCMDGNGDEIYKFYNENKESIDLHLDEELIFRVLCANGLDEIVKWIYSTSIIEKNKINIYAYDCNAVFVSCINGRTETAKYLYSLYDKNIFINVLHRDNHKIFRTICINKHIDMAIFLTEIEPLYKIIVNKLDHCCTTDIDYWVENDVDLYICSINEQKVVSVKSILNTQNIQIKEADNILKQINNMTEDDFTESTYYDKKTEKNIVDKEIRSSKTSKKPIDVIIMNTQYIYHQFDYSMCSPFKMNISTFYDCIKYEKEGKFEWHSDYKLSDTHNYTVLLYPPQKVEGGELKIKMYNGEKIIKMNEHKWTIVFMDVNIMHTSAKVLSGEKITLKGKAFIGMYDESIGLVTFDIDYKNKTELIVDNESTDSITDVGPIALDIGPTDPTDDDW